MKTHFRPPLFVDYGQPRPVAASRLSVYQWRKPLKPQLSGSAGLGKEKAL